MGKKSPKAPDPVKLTNSQTQSNKDTALFNAAINRMDQTTPFGTQTYQYGGLDENGLPKYTSNTTLSPEQQQILSAQNAQNLSLTGANNAVTNRLASMLSSGIDLNALPGLQTRADGGNIQRSLDYSNLTDLPGIDDFSADRQRVEDAIYSRLDPKFQRDEEALRTRLANQGIMEGSEAYNREIEGLNQAKNDARMQTILAGGNEQSRLFNLALSGRQQGQNEVNTQGSFANAAQQQAFAQALSNANLNNQARAQAFGEQIDMRQMPFDEMNAIRGATALQIPQFVGPGQSNMSAVDTTTPIMNNYNQKMASKNNQMSSIMGLGGMLGSAALGGGLMSAGTAGATGLGLGSILGLAAFCDVALKENLELLDVTAGGVPLYRFNYVGDKEIYIGPIAQELMLTQPDAVFCGADGYLRIHPFMVR